MADLTDVENALTAFIGDVIYPNGTGTASVLGVDCRIYPGWPNAAELDADLRAGKVNVSVYPQPNVERNTSRFPMEWKTSVPAAPKITLALASNAVTVGGTIQAGDVATVKIGARKAYSVAVAAGDTTDTVAAALQALIVADYTASVAGPVITITTGETIAVLVGGQATSWRELRRQEKGFQVIVWAPTPAMRATAASAIDVAFAAIEFLTLADQSAARIKYIKTVNNDAPQKELLYRRDLFYMIEYPTTQTELDTTVTAVVENVQGGASPADAPQVTTVE